MKKPNIDQIDFNEFKPLDFMRARRPNLFSDSKIIRKSKLTHVEFEYHLDTLTSRKQEYEFEHFCRRLVEKEICPNLISQSGPTGGGDSKIDTETDPVADSIALRWYEGIGTEASKERWAFAFSAMKRWDSKVNDDVKKIANTKRDYKLIFFITNQFVRDKTRAAREDALTKKYRIRVCIRDRNWITKCIFEHDRLKLAIETLNLTGDYETIKEKGPLDVEREKDLKDLEKQIEDQDRYRGVEYQLAEDCLQAAVLARGLEYPRVEIEGRFSRAQRISNRVGYRQQELRIAYAKAWTAFWWFNDFEELNQLYDKVEEYALGSEIASDLELLANIWRLLHSSTTRGKLDKNETRLEQRTEKLKSELDRLASNSKRPNNALLARTNRLLLDLNEYPSKGFPLNATFEGLKEVLVTSEGLPEYPVESISDIMLEMGNFITDSSEYDELLDTVISTTEKRKSEGEVGIILLNRGEQQLRAGKNYDAIRYLGKAQQKLAKDEYYIEWIISLVGCGMAYESAGLIWAARSNLLTAVNQLLTEHRKHGKIIRRTIKYIQRLFWLEIQLGRIFPALAWVELSTIASNLVLEKDDKDEFAKERKSQDQILGLLLLKIDFFELKWLDFLPQILDKMGLDHSYMALLYALGHEKQLRSDGLIPESESPEDVHDLFEKWLDQPANQDLPDKPELMLSRKITLRSFVIGCEVIIEAENNNSSIYLAETILGTLEAFLATNIYPDNQLIPFRSEIIISVKHSDFINGLPEYQIKKNDEEPAFIIKHSNITKRNTQEEQEAFRQWLTKLLLNITLHIASVKDKVSFAKNLGNELSLGRAINFSEVAIHIENILGQEPKFRLEDWENQSGTKKFSLQRNLPWNHSTKKTDKDEELERYYINDEKGEIPKELFGIDNLKHKDLKITSFINIPLWDKAKWHGTAYGSELNQIPILALCFKNPEAGKQIFKEWRKSLGEIDKEERLRITIITGIDRNKPSSYKVLVSANPESSKYSLKSRILFVSRFNQMDPPDQNNLKAFLHHFKRRGIYCIMPAHLVSNQSIPQIFQEFRIGKQELYIRPAWQIGEHDLELVALQEEDDPIIPSDIKEVPIVRALERVKKMNFRL